MSDNKQFRIGDVVRHKTNSNLSNVIVNGVDGDHADFISEGVRFQNDAFLLVFRPPTRAEHEALQARVAELEGENLRLEGVNEARSALAQAMLRVTRERDEARAELARYEAAGKSETVEGIIKMVRVFARDYFDWRYRNCPSAAAPEPKHIKEAVTAAVAERDRLAGTYAVLQPEEWKKDNYDGK